MKTEINFCPFCGSRAYAHEEKEKLGYVMCNHCKARTGLYYTTAEGTWREKAIKAWNRRTEVTE